MAVDVIMPQMGESIFEGTITKWLKKARRQNRARRAAVRNFHRQGGRGDSVALGRRAEGNQGHRRPDGAHSDRRRRDRRRWRRCAAPLRPLRARKLAAKPAARWQSAAPPSRREMPPRLRASRRAPQPARSRRFADGAKKVRSSPLVRRIARENNVDLSQVPGTGAGGRVSKSDILGAVRSGGAPAAAPSAQPRVRARRRRSAALCLRHSGWSCCRRSRNRRAPREDVFRPLRSPAHVRDAPAHRRAHGALEARFAARLFRGRSRTSPPSPRCAPK